MPTSTAGPPKTPTGGTPRAVLALAVAASVVCAGAAAAPAGSNSGLPGGTQPRVWRGEIISLPTDGASDGEPTTGNGVLAAALNSATRSPLHGPAVTAGEHVKMVAQLYLGSNNMWEFVQSQSNYTSKYYPAAVVRPTGIGNRVALGGLTISLVQQARMPAGPQASGEGSAADNSTSFYAEERVATGEIFARRSWPGGAAFELTVSIERSTGTVLTTCVWLPSASQAGAAAVMDATVEVSTWVAAGRPSNASMVPRGSGVGVVSRGAVQRSLLATSPASIVGALATTLLPGGGQLLSAAARSATNDSVGSQVRHRLQVQANVSFSLATTYSDSILAGNGEDPAAAAAAAAGALSKDEGARASLERQSTGWWRGLWRNASISLPAHPGVEYVWYTANYMLARDSSARSDVAAPGLFGPMITDDKMLWGADYTLDFDFEKQYFGVMGSNHGELASAFFSNIMQFAPSASRAAQQYIAALRANGTAAPGCTPGVAARALHFPCHIGPFGFQSKDRSIYNHWNGELAALIFINHWEYYRDTAFAEQHIYPLLDSLTAFRICSLTRSEDKGGHRFDILDDSAHEGFIVNVSSSARCFPNTRIVMN
eukprot:SAG22_NODE_517_length_9528_cov_3.821508_7_plen_600_part_00